MGVGTERGSTEPEDRTLTATVGGPKRRTLLAAAGLTQDQRYVELEEIGRGGMGRVCRAYDTMLQREVALKTVLRRAIPSDEHERLIVEARAMARLSHPNVVAIYDAYDGEDGIVLSMELVRGRTLAQWIREGRRSWPEVIDALERAGRGLAAAHAVGLLHRDFKPSNVLCAEDGGRLNLVKVTDFGLARLSEGLPSPTEMLTDSGESYSSQERLTLTGVTMGTPAYMAPEQHAGEPLTPAVDQYAFCVALWEALTTARPFTGGLYELHDRKLLGPPSWPRGVSVPRSVVAVVARGLNPEPARRWPSMAHLLAALAKAGNRRRRRRWSLGGLTLLTATAGVVWAAQEPPRCVGARRQLEGVWDDATRALTEATLRAAPRPYAARTWRRVEAGLDEFAEDWVQMHTEACEATAIHGTQSSEVLDLRMACLHRARTALHSVTEVLGHADAEVLDRADRVMDSLPPLAPCSDVHALLGGVDPPLDDEVEAVEAARDLLTRASTLSAAGKYQASFSAVEQAESLLSEVDYEPVRIECTYHRARAHERLGHQDEAREGLRVALMRAVGAQMWTLAMDTAIALALVVGERQARYAEGLIYIELAEALAGDQTSTSLARIHQFTGIMLVGRREYDAARERYGQALDIIERLDHSEPIVEAHIRDSLSICYMKQKQLDAAMIEGRRALELLEEEFGSEHPEVAAQRTNLGGVLMRSGQAALAEVELREALRIWVGALGREHPDVALARTNLGTTLGIQGDHEAAEGEFREALRVQEPMLAADHPQLAMLHHNLGLTMVALGRMEDAEFELRRATWGREASLGADHPELAMSRAELGEVLLARGRPSEARALLEQAWAVVDESSVGPETQADVAFKLAQACWAQGDPSAAASLLVLAEKRLEALGPRGAGGLAELRRWTDEHRVVAEGEAPR